MHGELGCVAPLSQDRRRLVAGTTYARPYRSDGVCGTHPEAFRGKAVAKLCPKPTPAIADLVGLRAVASEMNV